MVTPVRDARPFLAHHLRSRGDARQDRNGAAIHLLARWVENLPSGDPNMARIAGTDALNDADGSVVLGPDAEALIDSWESEAVPSDRDLWLEQLAAAVERWHLGPAGVG
jgi:hypothetical protein